MKKKNIKILLIVLIIIALITTCGVSYARYVLTKHFETNFSSAPFYFEANVEKHTYNYSEAGINIPVNIFNYVDNLYNTFNTEYEILLESNTNFQLENNLKGVINGNNKEEKKENIKINPIAGVEVNGNVNLNIIVKANEPYSKEIKIPITIKKSDNIYSFMENLAAGKTDQDIDFTDTNIVDGVYMNYETKDTDYPVYYYRGAISNNNAIYANYCWKMVRTTLNGGIKLVYSGDVSGGQCKFTHDYLGSEAFNYMVQDNAGEEAISISQVGYKFEKIGIIGEIAPSYINDTSVPRKIETGTIFGHDVRYDIITKKYNLVNPITITNLDDLEDDIRGGSYGEGYHYTCLTNEDSCSNVYYIYYNDYGNSKDSSATGLYGISLEDGSNATETLEKILYNSSNTKDSHAKEYLDKFFRGEGSDFTRAGGDPLIEHLDELDDVPWCNDRTVAGLHGWDISVDNHNSHNKKLHFAAFGRLIGDEGIPDSRPDLYCDIDNDAFTVNKENGNGALEYPIGMLTADEAVLAGAINEVPNNNYLKLATGKNQFFMTPYYISDDHVRMFTMGSDGSLNSGYSEATYIAIRAAIALKPEAIIVSGDGTATSPFQIQFSK